MCSPPSIALSVHLRRPTPTRRVDAVRGTGYPVLFLPYQACNVSNLRASGRTATSPKEFKNSKSYG